MPKQKQESPSKVQTCLLVVGFMVFLTSIEEAVTLLRATGLKTKTQLYIGLVILWYWSGWLGTWAAKGNSSLDHLCRTLGRCVQGLEIPEEVKRAYSVSLICSQNRWTPVSQPTLGATWEPSPDFQHSHDWNVTEMARDGLSGGGKKREKVLNC